MPTKMELYISNTWDITKNKTEVESKLYETQH